jgi:putative hemolysin
MVGLRHLAFGVVMLLCVALLISACGRAPGTDNTSRKTQIANPAATKCINDGYQYDIRNNPDGSQAGVCIISANVTCDGWAYYRGECR